MANIAYCSYNMRGKKEDFADWISDISPIVTPFVSMTKKFPVENPVYEWQTQELRTPDLDNACIEGSTAEAGSLQATMDHKNYTQIFRKVIVVSDTAGEVGSYGRNSEIKYQIEKASKELKRDVEYTLLSSSQVGRPGTSSEASVTTSFLGFHQDQLHGAYDAANFEKDLFSNLESLYEKGAEVKVLMYHPHLSRLITNLQEKNTVDGAERVLIFENETKHCRYVANVVDPLGQELACIPNIFMPIDTYYLIDPDLIDIAVLREPVLTPLGKTGSAEKWMIEKEIGLRVHNLNSFAYGYYKLGALPTNSGTSQEVSVGGDITITTVWPAEVTKWQWYNFLKVQDQGTATPIVGQTTDTLSKPCVLGDFDKKFFCRGYVDNGSFNDSTPVEVTSPPPPPPPPPPPETPTVPVRKNPKIRKAKKIKE